MAISISKKCSSKTFFIENYYEMCVAITMADHVELLCAVNIITQYIEIISESVCVSVRDTYFVVFAPVSVSVTIYVLTIPH